MNGQDKKDIKEIISNNYYLSKRLNEIKRTRDSSSRWSSDFSETGDKTHSMDRINFVEYVAGTMARTEFIDEYEGYSGIGLSEYSCGVLVNVIIGNNFMTKFCTIDEWELMFKIYGDNCGEYIKEDTEIKEFNRNYFLNCAKFLPNFEVFKEEDWVSKWLKQRYQR
jgi:hypothetical protein